MLLLVLVLLFYDVMINYIEIMCFFSLSWFLLLIKLFHTLFEFLLSDFIICSQRWANFDWRDLK